MSENDYSHLLIKKIFLGKNSFGHLESSFDQPAQTFSPKAENNNKLFSRKSPEVVLLET